MILMLCLSLSTKSNALLSKVAGIETGTKAIGYEMGVHGSFLYYGLGTDELDLWAPMVRLREEHSS